MLRDLEAAMSGTVRRRGCTIAWQEFG